MKHTGLRMDIKMREKMTNYLYSASTNSFYPISMRKDYEKAGTLPNNLIEVNDDVFNEFSQNKDGFYRSSNESGYPTWVEIPPPTQQEIDAEKEAKNITFLSYEINRTETKLTQLYRLRDRNKASESHLSQIEELEDYSTDLMLVEDQEGYPLNADFPTCPDFFSE